MEESKNTIVLDGSQGLGFLAYLTILTATENGVEETTYELPYALISFTLLIKAVDNNFILGYKVEKRIPKDAPVMRLNLDDMGGHQ